MELDGQRFGVNLGLIVALLAVAIMAWQVAALWGFVTHPGPHRLGVRMVWICLGGGALLVVGTEPRIWWPVLYVTALVPIAALVIILRWWRTRGRIEPTAPESALAQRW